LISPVDFSLFPSVAQIYFILSDLASKVTLNFCVSFSAKNTGGQNELHPIC